MAWLFLDDLGGLPGVYASPSPLTLRHYSTNRPYENSEAVPTESVAAAVMTCPAENGAVKLKEAFPRGSATGYVL